MKRTILSLALALPALAQIPRTADGKPDLSGIWQAFNTSNIDLQDHVAQKGAPAGQSVVEGNEIPYQTWALAKKKDNYANRATLDPENKCYLPGVPRVTYLGLPFQIFERPDLVTILYEHAHANRFIYTNGSPHPKGPIDWWMGDSRGHWEGDTLVVDVAGNNDQTWLDMAGDFHSEALHVTERYTMTALDTISYEATIEDPKVFSNPWTIRAELQRRTDRDRLFEYVCQAEAEEVSGAFTREERTWYPGIGTPPPPMPVDMKPHLNVKAAANIRRMRDGKPDLQGVYESDNDGANQGVGPRGAIAVTGRVAAPGVVIDPPDKKLPFQPWAAEEFRDRGRPERGYDDPTAHSFPGGVPRSMHIPAGIQIVQTPDYVVFLHERIAWRIVPLKPRPHLPENMRLWQGDPVGHWEGDTLVIDTTNLNGKTWMSEAGDVMSYAAHVVERLTPTGPREFQYEATVYDPVAYAKPWTLAYPVRMVDYELPESAGHEEDRDLPHMKLIKDQAAAKKAAAAAAASGK